MLHPLNEHPIGSICRLERIDLIPRCLPDDERVHLAVTNGVNGLFGLVESLAQQFIFEGELGGCL